MAKTNTPLQKWVAEHKDALEKDYKSFRDTLDRVHYARSAVAAYFQEKWDSAYENARFFRLRQYTDTQLQKFLSQNRVPYVLDYLTNAVNVYIGTQRDTRTDITFRPVKKDDELRIELLNVIKDNVLNSNDFIFLESDVFQDGIVEKTGAVGMEWSTQDNPMGELKLYRIPPRQLTWDLNRREYQTEQDGQWISRTRIYAKKQLAMMYPDYAKEIMNLSLDSGYFDTPGLDESYFKQIVDYELGAVALIEFFEVDYKNRHFIFNYDANEFNEQVYKTRKAAESAIREIRQKFEQQISEVATQAGIMPPPPPMLDVITRQYKVIKKSEVIHDMVVNDVEETEFQHLPITTYHPFWHDGEWWSVVDTFKDPQRFINKMFAMIDHQLGAGSKGLLIIDDQVPEPQANLIINKWSTTGGAFRMKDPKNNITFIPPTGFDYHLIESMQVALQAMMQKAGGANFLGGREGAAEAAAAIRQRIEQGGLGHFMLFDNLSRWKKSLGEKILWYLTTYMKAPQKVRIEGKELTQLAMQQFTSWFKPAMTQDYGFVSVNTEESNTIAGLKADIVVDEAKHSSTRNQATLAQLAMLMQSSPLFAETIPPQLMLELSDIPESVKVQCRQWMEQLLQQRQESQNKGPALTAKLEDISKLPPEMQPAFAKLFGLEQSQPIPDAQAMQDMLKMINQNQAQDKELAHKKNTHEDHVILRMLGLLKDVNTKG